MTQLAIADLTLKMSLTGLAVIEQQLVVGGQTAPAPGPAGPSGTVGPFALNLTFGSQSSETATLAASIANSYIYGGINQTVNF